MQIDILGASKTAAALVLFLLSLIFTRCTITTGGRDVVCESGTTRLKTLHMCTITTAILFAFYADSARALNAILLTAATSWIVVV